MRCLCCTIVLLCLLTGIQPILAQQNLFKTYSVNDGLPHNHVRCIYQDSKGFIWIGTWEGLSKYDGYKFTNYTTANGLAHDVINDICETKDGKLYITCNDGSLYLVQNNESPKNITQHKIIINRLRTQQDDRVIAVTDYNGIQEFKNGRLSKLQQSNPANSYFDILPLNDSHFVAQSQYTIEVLDRNFEFISEWKEKDTYFEYSSLYADSKNRVWLGSIHGLKLLSPRQVKGRPLQFLDLPKSFDHPLIRNKSVKTIFEDHYGNFWIGTALGLLKIGTDGSKQVITDKTGLPEQNVSCIYEDREKNLWIGTSFGLVKLVTKNNIHIYTEDEGLLSNNVYMIFPLNKNKTFLETEKGAQIFDRTTSKFEPAIAEKDYLPDDEMYNNLSLLRNNTSKLRYITFSQDSANRFSFGPYTGSSLYLIKDKYGNLLYPGRKSGLLIGRDLVAWEYYFQNINVESIFIDSKNNLWVGSRDSGLYRIKYKYVNSKIEVLSKEHFLQGRGIRSFFEDSKGNLWVGTRYEGIFCINAEKKNDPVVHHFDKSAGLTSNRIICIGEDKTGAIWICSYNGLDKLIPGQTSYRVFNFSRFNNFFVTINGLSLDQDNSLWLATAKGLIQISNDRSLENSAPLKTYITAATLGDSIYRNDEHKKISLGYKHKPVNFEFAAPGFINEKQVFYSYRLVGSNNADWSQPSNEHSVSYANLQPGTYRFEVRTLGWNGQLGKPDIYEFSIGPPFWQTWWFITAIILMLIAAAWLLVRRRIKVIRHKGEMKHRIAETEMMALRAQMNPHFIFNCLGAIDNLIQTNQRDKATSYLARFARLIRAVLDSSKNNVVPFQKDLETLQLYLEMEQFRCNNKFSYEMNVDPPLLHSDYQVPPLLIQPFIENAIHHGLLHKKFGDRQLQVSVQLEDDHIVYSITDNGVGREKAAGFKERNKPDHQSYGIAITRERIHLYNQNGIKDDLIITDLKDNGVPSGTKAVVRINCLKS